MRRNHRSNLMPVAGLVMLAAAATLNRSAPEELGVSKYYNPLQQKTDQWMQRLTSACSDARGKDGQIKVANDEAWFGKLAQKYCDRATGGMQPNEASARKAIYDWYNIGRDPS